MGDRPTLDGTLIALSAKVAKLETRRDRFAGGDPRREPSERKLAVFHQEIARCWRKYQARNADLAHLAANVLILLATVWEADLIAGESLKSLKTEGRGRSAKGRSRSLAQYLPDSGGASCACCATNAISAGCAWCGNIPEEPPIPVQNVVNLPTPLLIRRLMRNSLMQAPGYAARNVAGTGPETTPQPLTSDF
jgi:hypothetical protein